MKKISMVNAADFLQNLMGSRGAYKVSIIAETVPEMRKTGNPYLGRVIKRAELSVILGGDYTNAVNNAQMREQEAAGIEPTSTPIWRPKPRKWGVRINGTPVVEHKGQYYLEVRPLECLSVGFLLDGVVVDDQAVIDHIKSFIPTKSSNAKHQGVSEEAEVIWRDYKLTSVKALTYAGETTFIEAA